MVNAGIYLSNSAVNGGQAVNFYGATATYKWVSIVGDKPIPGKYALSEVDKYGFENPNIVITGEIDVNSLPANNTGSDAVVSEIYLKKFSAAQTTDTYLTIGIGADTIGFTNYAGTETSIKVIIRDFQLVLSADNERGHIIRYSINMSETA